MAMSPAWLAWDDRACSYDFGPGHPLAPVRLRLTARLCADLGLLAPVGPVEVVAPVEASVEALGRVHDLAYVVAVQAASADPANPPARIGLGPGDTPAFAGMHEAAALIAGASIHLAEAVWAGRCHHGVNFCGGLHHAQRGSASGFCVYNDAALAIAAFLDAGAERVVYIDLDVHHGDGVEAIFADEPRVTTVSIHESARTLFPGTGDPSYVGGPGAQGSAVNVALPAGTDDSGWLRAIHAVVPAVVRAEQPDVIVSQHGCDTHVLDPLAHLAVSVDGQRIAAGLVHDLAHEVSAGRWLALGGGGYEVVDVVPRTWAHLVAIAGHVDLAADADVPEAWRDHVRDALAREAPRRMTDGAAGTWSDYADGHDPADPVDRAIQATRRAAFPYLGLDPWTA